MKIIEISESQFTHYSKKNKLTSFFQTVNWANSKQSGGWESLYVGLVSDDNDDNILAASMILSKIILGGKKVCYSPRGFLIDYDDKELLKEFTLNIKKYIKKHNGIFIKIDPLVEYQKHDRFGVAYGDNKYKLVSYMKSLEYHHKGFSHGYSEDIQFRWSYAIDSNLTEFDNRCKRCIKKSNEFPIIIKNVDKYNINDYKKIMEHTAHRQNHFDRTSDYYLNLKKNFGDDLLIVVAYLDKELFLENFPDHKLVDVVKKERK